MTTTGETRCATRMNRLVAHLRHGCGDFRVIPVEEPLEEMLVKLNNRNEEIHVVLRRDIHHWVADDCLSEVQISTLLTVICQLYLSTQSLLSAPADALLDTHSATDFGILPARA